MSDILVDARILPYNRSGISRYVLALYRAMAQLPSRPDGARPPARVLYHRTDRRRELADCWPSAGAAWTPPHHRWERIALAAELVLRRPSLVHSPDHVCPQPLGWKTVLTVHDLAFWRLPETHSAASRAYYAGVTRSARQATRIVCISHATKDDLLALTGVDGSKVRVVYEAPDPRYVRVGDSADDDLAAAGEPYFVFVGTVERRKNVANVLRALAQVSCGTRLEIVGSPGNADGEARQLVEQLGLQSRVRFRGPLPTAEVAALYRGARALVYPSLMEGFGLPILEAMACGAPVLTSDRSSMAEVAGDAAMLADPEDVDALAGAMQRLAQDDDHRQILRKRGFMRAAGFSWERAARETLEVFAEALAA